MNRPPPASPVSPLPYTCAMGTLLGRWSDGELSRRSRRAMMVHVARCSYCAAEHAELLAVGAAVREVFRAEIVSTSLRGLTAAVMAAVEDRR